MLRKIWAWICFRWERDAAEEMAVERWRGWAAAGAMVVSGEDTEAVVMVVAIAAMAWGEMDWK